VTNSDKYNMVLEKDGTKRGTHGWECFRSRGSVTNLEGTHPWGGDC